MLKIELSLISHHTQEANGGEAWLFLPRLTDVWSLGMKCLASPVVVSSGSAIEYQKQDGEYAIT